MPWSALLKAAMAGTGAPEITLARYPFSNTPGQNTGVARSVHKPFGIIGLSPGAPLAMSSQSVNVPGWASNRGSFRLAFSGVSNGKWLAAEMPRGAMCEVSMRYPGMSAPERVLMGRVNGMQGIGPQLVMDAWDMVAAAATRPSWLGADESELFYHCTEDSSHTGALNSAYTVGDSTIQLTASPAMERETGGTGAVLVTPAGGGTPFILTYTGTSGNNLTGASSTAVYGTTASAAGVGSKVQEVVWIDDTPTHIALKILTSTGTGANGLYDTLPASWGFGFPAVLVDTLGFTAAGSQMTPSTGTHELYAVSTQPQPQGFNWLQSFLQTWAVWLTMRQGEITCRAAVDRYATPVTPVMTIDRNNIIATLPNRAIWDQGTPVEYGRIRVLYNAGASDVTGSIATVRTRPAAHTYDVDTGLQLYQNETPIAENLISRLGGWFERVPSVVEIGCTLAAAQLCPGDWVLLELPGAWVPYTYTTSTFYAMVGAVTTDWTAGQVAIRLYVQHPGSEA